MNVSWTAGSCDSTPPVITPNVTPASPNGNGWYKNDVSVSWTVTDAQSAVTSKSAACDTTTNITQDTAASGQTVSCTATSAGGTDTKSVTIKLDKTAPTNIQWVAPTLVARTPSTMFRMRRPATLISRSRGRLPAT